MEGVDDHDHLQVVAGKPRVVDRTDHRLDVGDLLFARRLSSDDNDRVLMSLASTTPEAPTRRAIGNVK